MSKAIGVTGLVSLAFWLSAGLAGLWAGPGRRGAKAVANNLLFALIVLGILGFVNYIAYRHNWRWDVTKNKYYALSEMTKNTVAELTQDVEVTAFISPDTRGAELIRNTLREYDYLPQQRLKVELVDPVKARGTRLAGEMGVEKQQNVIIVKCGDKKETVHIYQPDILEEKLTSAIMAVTTGQKPKIYFLAGHGEYKPDPDQRGRSWSVVRDLLKDQQYEVATLDFSEKLMASGSSARDMLMRGEEPAENNPGAPETSGEDPPDEEDDPEEGDGSDDVDEPSKQKGKSAVSVPDDCAALVIAGAQTPLFPEEEEAIKAYLKRNGHVVIALAVGARFDIERQRKVTAPSFNDILSEYKIRVSDGLILEPAMDLFGQRTLTDRLLVSNFGAHDVAQDLDRIDFPGTRPVHFEDQPPPPNPYGGGPPPSPMGVEFMKTSSDAWAETNPFVDRDQELKKDSTEKSGPLPVAVAYGKSSEKQEEPSPNPMMPPPPAQETPRIVVFGSAMAFSDPVVDNAQVSNFAAITKAIAWCSGRPNLVSIPPKHMETKTLSIDRKQQNVVKLVHILMLLGIAGSGVYVWWRRR